MSQNLRNQPGEGQRNTARGDEQKERSSYEGFEGMNYEQRRQPFNPQQMSNKRNQEDESSGRNGGDES